MSVPATPFFESFHGYFRNLLRWEELDAFWEVLRAQPEGAGWYIYAVGEAPPGAAASHEQLHAFIEAVDALLHKEHEEEYCGIVYVDSADSPTFVKIYDPNNLGSVCGSGSQPPPLPGWILSRIPPEDLPAAFPQTASRRRWWQRLFA